MPAQRLAEQAIPARVRFQKLNSAVGRETLSYSPDVCDDAGVVHVFFFGLISLMTIRTGKKGNSMSTRVSSLVVALAVMFLIGCSEMPTTELESAEQALLAARTAEAEQYAPAIYQQAIDSLNAAKDEIARQSGRFALLRSYGNSKLMLESAMRLASQASTEAVAEKEEMRAETQRQLESASLLLTSVQQEFSSAPTGKGTKADLELIKSDIAAAEQMIIEAKTSFEEGSFVVAQTKLSAATDRLDQLMTEILAAKKRKSTNPRA